MIGSANPTYVEFVHDPKLQRWCPLGIMAAAAEEIGKLDLTTYDGWEQFARVVIGNEVSCPFCWKATVLELKRLRYKGLVTDLECSECHYEFRWYSAAASFMVMDETDPFYPTQPTDVDYVSDDLEPNQIPSDLREAITEALRCPICREHNLFQPIQIRGKRIRLVCRNAGCRQQFGIYTPKGGDKP